MNYYEHHLGDYAKDTAHLSMLEHGAYRLLLDRYYSTEAGIPADQAHRVTRARTREEKQAVDTVLNEFFRIVDGIWINQRAEEEIEKFSAKQPRAEEKRENDKERQRRTRERRKALFEELSSLGVYMPYNATTEELHATLSHKKSQVGHGDVTQPVTRDNTSTSHQSPYTSKHREPSSSTEHSVGVAGRQPTTEAEWLGWFNREHGLSLDPVSSHDRKGFWPLAARWCKVGVTVGQMSAAIAKAHADAKEPIAYLPSYVDRVLGSMTAPKPPQTGRQAAISNYAAQAAQARGEGIERTASTERDITGEAVRVA